MTNEQAIERLNSNLRFYDLMQFDHENKQYQSDVVSKTALEVVEKIKSLYDTYGSISAPEELVASTKKIITDAYGDVF